MKNADNFIANCEYKILIITFGERTRNIPPPHPIYIAYENINLANYSNESYFFRKKNSVVPRFLCFIIPVFVKLLCRSVEHTFRYHLNDSYRFGIFCRRTQEPIGEKGSGKCENTI